MTMTMALQSQEPGIGVRESGPPTRSPDPEPRFQEPR
jgi:hypothetical protein